MLKINPAVSRAFVKRGPKIIAGTFLGEEDGRLGVICFSRTEAFASGPFI
jgi:hypothetical protein